MSWIPIVQVDITLNTSSSTAEGFGLPLFIAATDAFSERVRSYTSMDDLADDFTDETSAVYKAATQLWSQTPKVTQLSIGRRSLQYLLSMDATPVSGTTYSIQLTTDDAVTVTKSVTATDGMTVQTLFEAFQTAISEDATFGSITTVTITGTDDAARMLLESSDAATYFLKASLSSTSTMTIQSSAADTPAEFIANIEDYDNTWYFVALEDRTESVVLATATAISSRRKLFFTASANTSALSGTVLENATDIIAQMAQAEIPRVAVLWHHTAESDYPEMAYIAYGAPYDAGSISWGNAQLSSVAYSQQPTTGKPLNSSQKAALEARYCNYIDYDGGLNVVRHGKVSSGEWIDIIRGVDWMQSDLTSSLRDLLVNQKGGKVTYDDTGLTRVRQVIESSLERAVSRNFLESYVVTISKASAISTANKKARLLDSSDVSFTGVLAGAINDVDLSGTVSYE